MKNHPYKNTAIALIATAIAPFAFAQTPAETHANASASGHLIGEVSDPAGRGELNSSLETSVMGSESSLRDLQSIELSFDSTAVIAEVESATATTRNSALANAESRIEANADAMNEIQAKIGEIRGDAQTRMVTALNDAKMLEADVRSNIDATRAASEADFEVARDRLVASLEAYAEANAEVKSTLST